ncbi:MAG TPA: hypothetical protein VHE55_07770 [Fimbriimonadaceae bacterium]|nr:hypothetical protein [Fimbriimonadaceae bacterium]
MIFAPLIAIAILASGQASSKLGHWPEAMAVRAKARLASMHQPKQVSANKVAAHPKAAKSKTASGASRSNPKPQARGSVKTTTQQKAASGQTKHKLKANSADPYLPTPEEMAAEQVFFANWSAAISTGQAAIDAGTPSVAVPPLQAWLQNNPPDNSTVSLLADAYFRLNDPNDAYNLLGPLITTSSDPDILLRASLAAADAGEVYIGQREYCIQWILGSSGQLTDDANTLPQGNTPAALRVLSCIALASQSDWSQSNPTYYSQQALTLDPGNPVAAERLGTIYMGQSRYSEAIAAFQSGLARAEGGLLTSMKASISTCQWLQSHGG